MTVNLSSMSDALTRVDELVTIVDELQAKLAPVCDDLRAIEGFLDAFEKGAGFAAAGCAMGVAHAALDRMGEPHFEPMTVEVDPSDQDIAAAGERARIIVWLEGGAAWEALGAGDELGVSGVHPDDVGNILNSLAGLLRREEQS